MTNLTSEQIRFLTQRMNERYVREMEEISTIAARSRAERGQVALASYPADRLDAALADVANEADLAITRQDVADVRDIIAARQRLAAGTYGTCTDCGEPIGYERLLAYPTAKRCITCQREHEHRIPKR